MTGTSSQASSTAVLDAAPAHALGGAGERLRQHFGEVRFKAWFGAAWIESNTGETVRMAVPTRFVRDWLRDRYSDLIVDCFRSEDPACQRVEIVVRPERRS